MQVDTDEFADVHVKKQSRLSELRRLGVDARMKLLGAYQAERFTNLLAEQVRLGGNAQLGGASAECSPFQSLGNLTAFHGSSFRPNTTVSFDATHWYLLIARSLSDSALFLGFFLFLVEVGESLVEAIDLTC